MNWIDRVIAELITISDTRPVPGADTEPADERQSHLHIVAKGLAYGLSAQRLSIAAEHHLRSAGSLEETCSLVLDALYAAGEPITIGASYHMLNTLARSGELR